MNNLPSVEYIGPKYDKEKEKFYGNIDVLLFPTSYINEAVWIDTVVEKAVAEHSLNPQSIESAIRKELLPKLFRRMGMDKAKEVIEQVLQITRVGLARHTD